MRICSIIARGTVLGLALGTIAAVQAAPDLLTSELDHDHHQENIPTGAPDSNRSLSVAPPRRSRHDLEMLEEDVPSAASLSAARGTGSIIRVGSDVIACDYNNLTDAITNANDADTIYLQSTTALYLGSGYNIYNKSLTIRGGFESCTDNTPSGRTTLDADGTQRVFDIFLAPSNTNEMVVTLENLVITGGSTAGSFGGGGVTIEGRQGGLFVSMINVLVEGNETTGENRDGGGINVRVNSDLDSDGLMLTMDNDSEILSNSASGNGGGLACSKTGDFSTSGLIIRLGAINIAGNSATNGGGMAINSCSQVIYYSGGPVFLVIPTGAMFANTATENGGGIFVENGGRAFIYGSQSAGFGDSAHAAHVVANNANNGGAAYVTGENSRLRLDDAVMAGNEAINNGGGVFAGDQSSFLMSRGTTGACQPPESSGGLLSVPRCSRARNNFAGSRGGAFFSDNGAELIVEQTIMNGNEASLFGSLMAARSDLDSGLTASIDLIDSLAYDNRGDALFYAWTNSDISLLGTTVTDNNAGNHVFRAFTNSGTARVRVAGSIVWDPDRNSVISEFGAGTFNLTADCLISHQDIGDTSFGAAYFYSNINPQLMTQENKPYYPGPTSPAIDYCDGFSFPADARDLTNTLRGTAHQGPPIIEPPTSVNGGAFDLGAYETQWEELPDEIFQDRFE